MSKYPLNSPGICALSSDKITRKWRQRQTTLRRAVGPATSNYDEISRIIHRSFTEAVIEYIKSTDNWEPGQREKQAKRDRERYELWGWTDGDEEENEKNKGGIYSASLVAMSSLVAIAAIPCTATKRLQNGNKRGAIKW
jgi:hypothetical protein